MSEKIHFSLTLGQHRVDGELDAADIEKPVDEVVKQFTPMIYLVLCQFENSHSQRMFAKAQAIVTSMESNPTPHDKFG